MRATLIMLIAAATLMAGPRAHAADEAAARATAETLVDRAHQAMTASAPEAQRFADLNQAIGAAFDFGIWEKFLLGDIAEAFSEAERAEFRALLPGFLSRLYFDQFGKGLEAKPEIIETRPARRDVLVRAAIPRANGKKLPVDWRVRDRGDAGHRVIDIMVGGTSFLILKRDEFRAVFDQGGSAGLLAHVRANAS